MRKMKRQDHKEAHYQFISDMPWLMVDYNPSYAISLLDKYQHMSFPSIVPLKKDGSAI